MYGGHGKVKTVCSEKKAERKADDEWERRREL